MHRRDLIKKEGNPFERSWHAVKHSKKRFISDNLEATMGDNKSDTLGAKIQLFYRLGHIFPPFPKTNVVVSIFSTAHTTAPTQHWKGWGGGGGKGGRYQRINATSKLNKTNAKVSKSVIS